MAYRPDLPTRFFKVILPTITAQQKLKLPDKYVEEFGHGRSDVVRLTDSNGGVWCVRLEKEEETIWFHHGWKKFYEDHSIKHGYFVLFKYRGNSSFKVHIFDLTATEVHYPSYNSRNFEETNHFPGYSIPARQEEGDDDSLTILDSLPPKMVACSLQSPTPLRSVFLPTHDKNQSSRGKKKDLGKKVVLAAGTSSPTYPSFTVEMKANLTPQWVVYVPAQFAKDYLPKAPKRIELHDSDGKRWRVYVNLRPGCHTVRTLSTGWAAFARAKEIEPLSSQRRFKVNYVSGLNSFSGLKANNSVASLGLPVCTEYSFAKIVNSFKQPPQGRGRSADLSLPPAVWWRIFSRLLPLFQD